MDSYDLIDSVLEIGDNDLRNELFVTRFNEFYNRQFGKNGLSFNGAAFIYMLYSAVLSLPLTEKITKHGVDGLLVAKRGNKLKLIISYAAPDKGVSLKLVCFDSSLLANVPYVEQSLIVDARELLSAVKGRLIHPNEMKASLNEIHQVSFEYGMDQERTTVKPKITKVPNNIDLVLNLDSRFAQLLLVQQSQYAETVSIIVKQLQSETYGVVKYNCHAFTKLLIAQYLIAAQNCRLSMKLRDMYLSLLGSLEMNWAGSNRLKIRPVLETSRTETINGLMISHTSTEKRWKPESTPFVVQLLSSSVPPAHENYVENMYNKMVKKSPNTQSGRVLAIGIEYNKLLNAFSRTIDIASFQILPFTFMLDLNPMENLVDLLFKPYSQTTLPKIHYCIKNLNQMGQFGLQTYLYGQLLSYSKHDVEKFVFHRSTSQRAQTSFAFKVRGSEIGVQFDIFQTPSMPRLINEKKIVSPNKLDIKQMLHITVHHVYSKINDEQLAKVHLVRTNARLLDQADLQRQEVIPEGNWWPIFSVEPQVVLADIETRAEAFEELPESDRLHVMLDSLNRNLLRYQNKISFQDITHFMSGLFSEWNKIFYHGFLGILKKDDSPTFLSPFQSSIGEQESFATGMLRDINGNRFGIARLSTYEQHKSTFENCMLQNNIRIKRKSLIQISCLDDELTKHNRRKDLDDEQLPHIFEPDDLLEEKTASYMGSIKIKLHPHLETMSKVSKVIMTAQIFKDMVGALIRGDYRTFAVNTAFLASGPLLECLSMKMVTKSASLGDNLLGRSLIISAPFLSRLPIMGFVGFDLYEQLESYKSGKEGAMVQIAADSAILTIDFATASVEGAEALGVLSGVADVTGPIGFAIGTAIFVGVDVYTSVKAVSNIDAMVHLTSWQKFTTGFLSFLHVSPTKTVQKELFEKNAADASIDNAASFFKSHPSVKYYLFPSYQENGEFVENNIIDLRTNATKMAHSWPKDIANTKLICAGNSELSVHKTSRFLLNCSNSVGYESQSGDENALILMGHGNDTVKTFSDKPTTFLIGNGNKYVVGSSVDDTLILYGNDTTGYINDQSELRINNGTVSVNVVSNDTVANIYERYVMLSEKLNAVISVYCTKKNVSMMFGHGMAIHHGHSNNDSNHINILPNDPNHETYLIGEPASLKLPNETYTVIDSCLVEPFTTIVSQKILGNYDITVYNGTNLILTNLRYEIKEYDIIVLVFKDFFRFHELQTLRLLFFDQTDVKNACFSSKIHFS
uniref:Uncharacterized protein n=1 Tax=Romanomermis culicivorax TaxID=13658 RepID=A0A915HFR2_ROMCU